VASSVGRPRVASTTRATATTLTTATTVRRPPHGQRSTYQCQAELLIEGNPATSCIEALTAAEGLFGPQNPEISWQLVLAGRRHLRMKQPQQAKPLLERAFALAESAPVVSSDRPLAQAYLAIARHRLGQGGAELAAQAKDALAKIPGTENTRKELADEFD